MIRDKDIKTSLCLSLNVSCPQYPQPKVVLVLRGDGAGAGARGGGRAGAAPAAAVPLLRGHGGRGGAEAGGRQGDPARGDRAHRCRHHGRQSENSSPHHCYPRQTRRSSSAPPRAASASCAAPAAAASWRAAPAAATWSAAAARSTRPRSAPASPGSATPLTCSTSSCPSGGDCVLKLTTEI